MPGVASGVFVRLVPAQVFKTTQGIFRLSTRFLRKSRKSMSF